MCAGVSGRERSEWCGWVSVRVCSVAAECPARGARQSKASSSCSPANAEGGWKGRQWTHATSATSAVANGHTPPVPFSFDSSTFSIFLPFLCLLSVFPHQPSSNSFSPPRPSWSSSLIGDLPSLSLDSTFLPSVSSLPSTPFPALATLPSLSPTLPYSTSSLSQFYHVEVPQPLCPFHTPSMTTTLLCSPSLGPFLSVLDPHPFTPSSLDPTPSDHPQTKCPDPNPDPTAAKPPRKHSHIQEIPQQRTTPLLNRNGEHHQYARRPSSFARLDVRPRLACVVGYLAVYCVAAFLGCAEDAQGSVVLQA